MPRSSTHPIRVLLAGATTCGLVAGLSACGGSPDAGSGDNVVVGLTASLSGGAAAFGENIKTGLEMAVDKVNESGVEIDGKKVTVTLKALDDKYVPSTAATNAQRLADQDKAAVIFTPNAGAIKAMQQVNDGRSKFLISAYTSDPAIVQSGNRLTVMTPPNFASYAQAFAKKLRADGAKKLALLGTQSEYGQQWTKDAKAAWTEAGGTVGKDNSIDYATVSDFAGPVSKALAEKSDAIFLGGPSQPTALIAEEARKQGFKGSFFLMDQAKLDEMGTVAKMENFRDSVGVRPVSDYQEAGTEEFLKTYTAKAGKDKVATSESALNYSALPIFVKAMEISGTSTDPDKIREAMPEALKQTDESYDVQTPWTSISDAGHLLSDKLDAAYYDKSGKYQPFDVPQVDDSK
ncbi:ABC transporter substrate-binding protein [Brevibacterium sp. 91QC2O2]|uniref:ABC transporter substrate-binding protein n=1 Tax=Brevibacterium sp. 91QC2O2 TaxID=2968458 RepID=UPI00211CEFAC|nr:ABC transporter substrate-binding protein [Brevibacterium sp. 91QC2O2]MCQ9368982.1 ABC transporter substrate-binding protein [Brevibacterium sp. 91QC2O2]